MLDFEIFEENVVLNRFDRKKFILESTGLKMRLKELLASTPLQMIFGLPQRPVKVGMPPERGGMPMQPFVNTITTLAPLSNPL